MPTPTSDILTPLGRTELAAARFQALPQFWLWRDLLDLCYQGDEDAFLTDYLARRIPREVLLQFLETCPGRWLELQLLTRLVRAVETLPEVDGAGGSR